MGKTRVLLGGKHWTSSAETPALYRVSRLPAAEGVASRVW